MKFCSKGSRNGLLVVVAAILAFADIGLVRAALAEDATPAYAARLAELQRLDRAMLKALGTPDYMPAHDAFGAAMQRLADAPDIPASSNDTRVAELAKLQANGRLLGSTPKGSSAYAKFHEKFVDEIRALAAADSVALDDSPAARQSQGEPQ